MGTISLTNEKLATFYMCGKAFINSSPRSRLWYAVDKVMKAAEKKLKKVEALKEEKRREFAMKKDKGIYDLTPDGKWQFDQEGHKKLTEALEVIDETVTEISVQIIPEGEFDEKTLSFDLRNNFEGIVIPAIDYENFDWDKIPANHKDKKAEV